VKELDYLAGGADDALPSRFLSTMDKGGGKSPVCPDDLMRSHFASSTRTFSPMQPGKFPS